MTGTMHQSIPISTLWTPQFRDELGAHSHIPDAGSELTDAQKHQRYLEFVEGLARAFVPWLWPMLESAVVPFQVLAAPGIFRVVAYKQSGVHEVDHPLMAALLLEWGFPWLEHEDRGN